MGDVVAYYKARWEGVKFGWSRGRVGPVARFAAPLLRRMSQRSISRSARMASRRTSRDDADRYIPGNESVAYRLVGIGIVTMVFVVLFALAYWLDDLEAALWYYFGSMDYAQ